LLYTNDLPKLSILYSTDDTSIIYHPDTNNLQNSIYGMFASLNKLFKANKLTLHSNKKKIHELCL
jgi:hypothetical protein